MMRRGWAVLVLIVLMLAFRGYPTKASGTISVSLSVLSFGSVNVGTTSTQSFTVTNTGDGSTPLSVSVSGNGFTLVSAPLSLGPGQVGTISIRFSPTASTSYSGNVYLGTVFGSAAVSLSGTGASAAIISVSPSETDKEAYSFGYVPVGQTPTKTYTVHNKGTATLNGSATVSGAGFSISSGGSYSIASGGSANVVVRFAPTTSANFSGSLNFTGGGGASRTVTGSSVAPPATSLSPTTLDFGSVNNGGTSYLTIRVTNSGGGTLLGACTVSGTGFYVSGGSSYSLSAGQSANITIAFAPLSAANHTGTASFSGASSATVGLTGKGKTPSPSVSVSPASRDFGNINVGSNSTLSFTVQNTYDGPVTVTSSVAAPFSVTSGAHAYLGISQSTTVQVRFTPTSAGLVSDVVQFVATVQDGTHGSSSTTVSGTGVATTPIISIVPSSHDFKDVTVGNTRDTTFTVTNVGAATLIGSASVSAPGFSIVGSSSYSLGSGQRTLITVRFAPVSAITYSTTVAFSGGGGGTATVTGRGQLPPTLSISPSSLNFGSISVGQSADQRFTVTNVGGGTLVGNASLSGTGFSLVGTSSYSLGPSQSAMVTVRFAPTAATAYSGTVTFTGGEGATANLIGSGHSSAEPSPVISVTPASQDFGVVYVGQTKELAFTVTNTGGGALTGSASLSSSNFSLVGTTSYTLGSGQSTTILVRFGPTAATSYAGAVSFSGGGGATRPLSGTGEFTPTQPSISVSGNLVFGSVVVGATKDMTFTVTNIGTGTLTGAAALSGTGFSLVGSGSYSLAAGHSATITVRFTPAAITSYSGTATFTGGGGASRTLSGTGQSAPAPQQEAIISVSENLAFGSVVIGVSKEMTFTVTNIGTSTLSGNVTLTGTGFTLVGAGSYTLPAGHSTLIRVRFTPTSAVAYSGTATFTGGDGATRFMSGVGHSPPAPSGSPAISVSANLTFGSVTIGAVKDLTFTVTNVGTGTLTGTATLSGTGYSIVGSASYNLGAGNSAVITVRFAPTAARSYTGNAAFTGGGGATRSMNGSGVTSTSPILSVSPSTINYGNVSVGQTRDMGFTVSNEGQGTLTGSASLSNSNFVIVGTANYTLGAGQSTTITVRFGPSAATAYTGSIHFSGSGDSGSALCALQGVGVFTPPPPAVISVSPGLNFGDVPVGSSKDLAFTVTNTGGSTLSGEANTTLPFSFVGSRNYNLAPDQSAVITVRFSPGAVQSYNGSVSFTGGGGASRGIIGVGVQPLPPPGISITPSGLDFGTLSSGQSRDLTFTVTNTGGSNLTGAVALPSGTPFSLVPLGGSADPVLRIISMMSVYNADGKWRAYDVNLHTGVKTEVSTFTDFSALVGKNAYWNSFERYMLSTMAYLGNDIIRVISIERSLNPETGLWKAYDVNLHTGAKTEVSTFTDFSAFVGKHNYTYWDESSRYFLSSMAYIGNDTLRVISVTPNGTTTGQWRAYDVNVRTGAKNIVTTFTDFSAFTWGKYSSFTVGGDLMSVMDYIGNNILRVISFQSDPSNPHGVWRAYNVDLTTGAKTLVTSFTDFSSLEGRTYYYSDSPHYVLSAMAAITPPQNSFLLQPGQSAQITVRFSPTGSGNFSNIIAFNTNAGVIQRQIVGICGGQPQLTVTPDSLIFGHVPIGDPRDVAFTVSNTGSGTLTGSADILDGQGFHLLGPRTFTLTAGQSAQIWVRFSPPAVGVYEGLVQITSNVGTLTRPVAGQGVPGTRRIRLIE